jgi:hypothetical protein
MAGRLSVKWTTNDHPTAAGVTDISVESEHEAAADESVDDSSTESETTLEPETDTSAEEEETNAEVTTEETEEDEEEASASSSSNDEPVVTTYDNVELSLEDVIFTWNPEREFGKVTDVKLAITNNEQGTIKPSYFIMTMERYNDVERKSFVDTRTRTITAGEIRTVTLEVTRGFTYNKVTLGNDLNEAAITITLYDSADRVIASATNSFDLETS